MWWCISIKRNVKKNAVFVVILSVSLVYSTSCFADIIETLVMPGKVIESHKKYESDCQRCHKKLGSKSETKLCLDCHKRIASDVRNKKGFHGNAPGIRTGECRTCHTEHIGRKGDVVKFDSHSFDHVSTDFPLTGEHSRAKCSACHKKKLKYRDAESRCIQCHRKKNPHGGNLKKLIQNLEYVVHVTLRNIGMKLNSNTKTQNLT